MKLCTKQEMLRKVKKSEWRYMKNTIFFGNVNNILIDYLDG